jgi:heme/copper-type cytochrome/quinol oxidase subunit 2
MSVFNGIKRLINGIGDWILANTRICMPIILVVCVAVTVVIAMYARERSEDDENGLPEAESVGANDLISLGAIPDVELILITEELLAEVSVSGTADIAGAPNDNDNEAEPTRMVATERYREVYELLNAYYQAMAIGDVITAKELRVDLDDVALIRIEEMAKYIDYYDRIDVYIKQGADANSFVAYVSSEVKFKEIETLMPGAQTFYILPDVTGRLVIKKSQLPDYVYDYIEAVSCQDDVINMFNRVTVKYNDIIDSNEEVKEFVAYMNVKINENVGIILAQMEASITAEQIREDLENNGNTGSGEHPVSTAVLLARATDVVNIRSSDSENADRIDRAIVGQEFTVLEQKANGWSRISYQGGEAYIKSEFLEIIGELDSLTGSAANATVIGKVVARDSVRIRATPSTTGDV